MPPRYKSLNPVAELWQIVGVIQQRGSGDLARTRVMFSSYSNNYGKDIKSMLLRNMLRFIRFSAGFKQSAI